MSKRVIEFWQRKGLVNYALLPLTWLYCTCIALRRWLYRINLFKVTQFQVPIIIVGNLSVGGAGKTPLVIYLAKLLQAHGYQPGIVSRGYGGKATGYPLRVTPTTDPRIAGDEPVLLAQTDCPVYVAPKRTQAVAAIVCAHACDVILSDDGLQHYALARSMELVVIDGARRFGNGWCLPAGPLREPVTRLRTVDYVICNGTPQPHEFAMELVLLPAQRLLNSAQQQPCTEFAGQLVHAVAGIGNPARFFNLLRQQGLTIVEHAFPDHHAFQSVDFDAFRNDIILMTEKDAVKCRSFATENFWFLPVTVNLAPSFTQHILQKLEADKSYK